MLTMERRVPPMGSRVVRKKYQFEAGHRLLTVPIGHKCRRFHGHSYEVEISVSSELLDGGGFVIEFGELNQIVKPLIEKFDHFFMVEKGDPFVSVAESLGESILVLDRAPTAENLAQIFWEHLSRVFDAMNNDMPDRRAWLILSRVSVRETSSSVAEVGV
jgi:6-pyruvoyltetrahydropterin/6-carboxytetrahydropterin synthase